MGLIGSAKFNIGLGFVHIKATEYDFYLLCVSLIVFAIKKIKSLILK